MLRSAITPTRDGSVELLRVLCSFGVVLIHCAACLTDTTTLTASAFWGPLLFNGLARFSVPVFFIISGRFMLAKDYTIRDVLRRSGLLLVLLVFWGGVYFTKELLSGELCYTGLRSALQYILTGPIHLWFLWALLALYLLTPVLSVFARKASKAQFQYALTLLFLLGPLLLILSRSSQFPLIAAILEDMKTDFLLGFSGCFLLGGYLARFSLGKAARRLIYTLGVVGAVVTVLGTFLLSLRAGAPNNLLMSFFAPNVLLSSLAVYVFVTERGTENAASPRFQRGVDFLARHTLGIYCTHILILWALLEMFPVFYSGNRVLQLWILTALTYVTSFGLTFLLRKIPGVRRYLV